MSTPKKPEPATPGGGAPALEKGLDLLEALAAEPAGLTQKQLAVRIGRSVGEIFRMLGVLQRRGYISRDPRTGEYVLTLQLFRLATQHPPTRRLQQVALPIMDALAASTGHSCHLSMASGGQFLIVAQAEPPRPMGWTVKLGAVFPFSMEYASARVIAAFQTGGQREKMVRILVERSGQTAAQISHRLDAIAAIGHDMAASELAGGLTDLSCPVRDERGHAVAALTLPFVPRLGVQAEAAEVVPLLCAAAISISARIGGAVEPC
ncbi:MAG: IclR family transcriptional regulator [Acetobacteraceae bacterium]